MISSSTGANGGTDYKTTGSSLVDGVFTGNSKNIKRDLEVLQWHVANGTALGYLFQSALESRQSADSNASSGSTAEGEAEQTQTAQNASGNSSLAIVEPNLEDNIPGNEDVGIEIIVWEEIWDLSSSMYGHVSAVIDGISYSWEGNGMNKDTDPNNYINQRRTTSGGSGYVLDFGSAELNKKFKDAYLAAFNGTGGYSVKNNNCGHAFLRAINAIAAELGIKPGGIRKDDAIKPQSHANYIQTALFTYWVNTNTYYKQKGEGPNKK